MQQLLQTTFHPFITWITSWVSFRMFFGLLAFPLSLAGLLYHYQTKLIYIPDFPKNSKTEVWTPDLFQLEYEEIFLSSNKHASPLPPMKEANLSTSVHSKKVTLTTSNTDPTKSPTLTDPSPPATNAWTPLSSSLSLSSSSSSSTSSNLTLHAYLIKPSSSFSNPTTTTSSSTSIPASSSFSTFSNVNFNSNSTFSLDQSHSHLDDLVLSSTTNSSFGLTKLINKSPVNFKSPSYSKHSTILFFHGNAGNIGHRLPIARRLVETLHCNVFMLSYRGYGKSEGSPDELGLKMDAQTALDYLTSHPILKSVPILVFGQSIGGAVALHLVAKNPTKIAGLILENTFLSLPKLLPSVLPWLSPFRFLCHQVWDNESLISSLDLPILFLASKRDELIPPSHMLKLYELSASSSLRRFIELEFGTHNDATEQPNYFPSIREFVNAVEGFKTSNQKKQS